MILALWNKFSLTLQRKERNCLLNKSIHLSSSCLEDESFLVCSPKTASYPIPHDEFPTWQAILACTRNNIIVFLSSSIPKRERGYSNPYLLC